MVRAYHAYFIWEGRFGARTQLLRDFCKFFVFANISLNLVKKKKQELKKKKQKKSKK